MKEQIAIIIDALMLSVLTQSTKSMPDFKRDVLLAETSDWAVSEIMKVIQGNNDESTNPSVAG